jgi:hypothetical protein
VRCLALVDEITDIGCARWTRLGHPGVEMILAGSGQAQPSCPQPVQQEYRTSNVAFDVHGLRVGDIGLSLTATQAADEVPAGISTKKVLLVWARAGGDAVNNPLL